jgi:hypothetical protein
MYGYRNNKFIFESLTGGSIYSILSFNIEIFELLLSIVKTIFRKSNELIKRSYRVC